jgi:membrane protein YdbS with pleckstrin-like domain
VSYPEKLLADDEKVVEHLHPHWITLVPATLWFLLLCAASGAAIAFKPDGTTGEVFLIAVLVVAFVLFCWLSVGPWLSWRTTHYVITTHRILIRRGILRHTGRDIALGRISDVGFVRTLWDRVVNAGTLTIESASENGQEVLKNVPHSEVVQQTINRLIEGDQDRRARDAFQGASGFAPPAGSAGQYPPAAQYPSAPAAPGQYPPAQYPPQQYPPTQQYPAQQYPPTQQYPQQPPR